MTEANEKPDTFLWVLRGLTTLFLFGYLMSIYLAVFIGERFPSGEPAADLEAAGLLVLFGMGYALMWFGRELLAGILFIGWYAALWVLYMTAGNERFRDAPAFGTILLILGILFMVHRAGAGKRRRGDRTNPRGTDGG